MNGYVREGSIERKSRRSFEAVSITGTFVSVVPDEAVPKTSLQCESKSKPKPAFKPKPKRSALSPVTLRLTSEEREKLEELAAGMTLSAYIRACIFAETCKRRKRRPKSVVEDKEAVAEALALLGQSRIASNLNQLAYHANTGILIESDKTKDQIAEANAHLKAIRSLLVQALSKGQKASAHSQKHETKCAASRSAQTHNLSRDPNPLRKCGG